MQPTAGPRCFAPPLTEEALGRYRKLIDDVRAKTELRATLEAVYACCEAWCRAPQARPMRTRKGVKPAVVPLTPEVKEALRDKLPTPQDLQKCSEVFEAIDASADKPLRDAAFHLLWHATELRCGREPMTRG
jgi:hypothetical protein